MTISWQTLLFAVLSVALLVLTLWDRRRPETLSMSAPIFVNEAPHILFLGTSLTEGETWPAAFMQRLEACGFAPSSYVLSRAGETSRWGGQALLAAKDAGLRVPDVALIEFSVNDADIRQLISPSQSAENIKGLVALLQEMNPEVRVILLGMYPGFGIRGALRFRYGAYLTELQRIAARHQNSGYLDLTHPWEVVLRMGSNKKMPDGLHPASEIADQVNSSAIFEYLNLSEGFRC